MLAHSIERLELIRGPGSALYGGSAELAVVNVITRGGAMTGRWALGPEFREDRQPKFERGKAFVSGDLAGWIAAGTLDRVLRLAWIVPAGAGVYAAVALGLGVRLSQLRAPA